RRARDELLELVHVGRTAQMLDEIETNAANAAGMQLFEIAVRERGVHIRDAAITAPALLDRIEDHGVVDTVAARIDEHRTRQAERLLQLDEALERRIGRRIAAVRRIRIFVAGSEDVAMRVARTGRRP